MPDASPEPKRSLIFNESLGQPGGVRDYIGLVVCAPSVERKLRSKHGLTADLVREAIQYPARVMLAWDDDPRHGGRLVVLGTTATGRQLVVWLVPTPEWDPDTDVWLIKTARWVR